MSLETRWSEPALLSLAEVLQYTLEEHGEGQYNKMRKQVMDAVRKIRNHRYPLLLNLFLRKLASNFVAIKSYQRLKLFSLL